MKKIISILMTSVLFTTILLSGCASAPSAPSPAPAPAAPASPAAGTPSTPAQPAAAAPARTGTTKISYATSGQGGTFYTAGAGIAALVTENVPGLEVTAETTKGVVENMRLLASGETEMGFAYGSTAYDISNGTGAFEGQKYDGIRAVSNIHDGAMNIVALQSSGLATMADLNGKKLSIGPKGSGSADVSEQLLTSLGMMDKVNLQYLSFDDSTTALRDGHIDAMIIGGTTPVPALIELEASKPITFIPVDGADREKFLADHPYHVSYTIPADGYTGLTTPVETVGYSVIWVTNADVEDWVIYEMLKIMYSDEGRAYLENVQKAFKELSPGTERFEAIDLPLHPGAEQFYKETGVIQ